MWKCFYKKSTTPNSRLFKDNNPNTKTPRRIDARWGGCVRQHSPLPWEMEAMERKRVSCVLRASHSPSFRNCLLSPYCVPRPLLKNLKTPLTHDLLCIMPFLSLFLLMSYSPHWRKVSVSHSTASVSEIMKLVFNWSESMESFPSLSGILWHLITDAPLLRPPVS